MTAPIAITVGGVDITNRVPIESIVVTESGSRQAGKLDCDVMDAVNALTLSPKAQVQLWDVADGRYIFTGYLNPADLNMLGIGRSFHLSCDDLGEIIDLSLVPYESRPAETFYARMVYLISTYGPLMPQTWTYIDNPVGSLPACVYQNTNLRGAIEQTCSLAGTTMDYWIDGAGLIHATTGGAGAAPFVLRVGTPGSGEINPEEPFSITRDPKTIVNAYYIRGNNAAGSGWVTNGTSITLYGRREAYYDAPNATTGAMRDAVGNALLADNAQALSQGKVHVTAANGWKPGQTLTIVSAPQFDITSSTTFRINLVTRKYFAGGNTKTYDIQFGGLIPMWSTSIPSPQSWPGSRLAAGSLDLTPFASSIRPVAIVATLPALPDAAYPADSYCVLTTDHKLYQNVAGAWVNAVSTGLPVGFQAIPPVGSLPTLPNVAYPVGFVVFLTSDGKLYRNVAGAWTKAVDGGDIAAGSLGLSPFASGIRPVRIWPGPILLPDPDYPIGSCLLATGDGKLYRNVGNVWVKNVAGGDIDANSITASQIAADTITAGQIAAGAIGASEIAAHAVTAAAIAAGTITATEIAAATITGDRLVAGTVTASQIAAHTIGAAQIVADSITAAEIAAGAINVSELAAGAVTAAAIAVGSVTADKMLIGASRSPLIDNPSFEFGAVNVSGVVPGWVVAQAGGNIYLTTAASRTGAQSVILNNAPSGAYAEINSSRFPVIGGTYVGVSFWLGVATGSPNITCYIEYLNSAGAHVSYSAIGGGAIPAGWTWYSGKAAGGGAAYARVHFEIVSGTGASAYVDDVQVSYSQNLVNADGNVVIDQNGVAITNGALTVTNGSSVVIIDGQSNMLKVATKSFLSSASGPNVTTMVLQADYANGLTSAPSHTGFAGFAYGQLPFIALGISAGSSRVDDLIQLHTSIVSTNQTRVNAAYTSPWNRSGSAWIVNFFVFKESVL